MFGRVVMTIVFAVLLPLAACEVEQTDEGDLPDVDVQVEGGDLPEADVETGDVDVGTETDTLILESPTVDVEMPDEEDAEN